MKHVKNVVQYEVWPINLINFPAVYIIFEFQLYTRFVHYILYNIPNKSKDCMYRFTCNFSRKSL